MGLAPTGAAVAAVVTSPFGKQDQKETEPPMLAVVAREGRVTVSGHSVVERHHSSRLAKASNLNQEPSQLQDQETTPYQMQQAASCP